MVEEIKGKLTFLLASPRAAKVSCSLRYERRERKTNERVMLLFLPHRTERIVCVCVCKRQREIERKDMIPFLVISSFKWRKGCSPFLCSAN